MRHTHRLFSIRTNLFIFIIRIVLQSNGYLLFVVVVAALVVLALFVVFVLLVAVVVVAAVPILERKILVRKTKRKRAKFFNKHQKSYFYRNIKFYRNLSVLSATFIQ